MLRRNEANEVKQTSGVNQRCVDQSVSNDNIISENTLSLLRRVFSPVHADDLFEEMPEIRHESEMQTRIQANRPILLVRKAKVNLEKTIERTSALEGITYSDAIVHSNRSFNSENEEHIDAKEPQKQTFCDLVTI